MRKDQGEKTVSVRMPQELIQQLQALSFVNNRTVGAEIRTAVEEWIEVCRQDPRFMERLELAKNRQLEALSRLERA